MTDPETIAAHGLTAEEYERIVAILGRDPNLLELGIFSVMWSEHCSYKSSRIHLRSLPTEGARVLQGPGENAGILDIGDGLAAVFKIESHNHPSFIEPYQGAATGVGGIIRDIFTMGARPIALLDSLRFGSLESPATRRLVDGVVAGIAGYGNSIGIPTVGGEVAFDETYAGNPLVNVFCLGIAPVEGVIRGRAEGTGNAVYYVGASTGRDGIHGATMASAEFDDASAEKRPNVQVGDPFLEKLLLEACLEVLQTGALVGLQDMGAAGLTCSSCEMGARGGAGIDIDVARVPQRESGMTPYEIMLSESQERMLFIVRRGREAEVDRVFAKWDLHAVRIGEVTGDGLLRVRDGGRTVARIPNRPLADEAPLYDRPYREPADLAARQTLDPSALALAGSPSEVFPAARRLARHRQQALDLSAVRPHGAHQHHRAGRGRGRGRARQGDAPRACLLGRRQRAVLLPRSVPRGDAGRGRVGPQRRLRRGTADRGHQLPELRQPGAARDHVAVRPRGGRDRRRVPRPRHPHHRRQRQSLQRDGRPGDTADPGTRGGGHNRGRRAGRRPHVPRGRGGDRAARGRGRHARRQRVPEGDARARPRRTARAGPGRGAPAAAVGGGSRGGRAPAFRARLLGRRPGRRRWPSARSRAAG